MLVSQGGRCFHFSTHYSFSFAGDSSGAVSDLADFPGQASTLRFGRLVQGPVFGRGPHVKHAEAEVLQRSRFQGISWMMCLSCSGNNVRDLQRFDPGFRMGWWSSTLFLAGKLQAMLFLSSSENKQKNDQM